jgi:hypothetical protein
VGSLFLKASRVRLGALLVVVGCTLLAQSASGQGTVPEDDVTRRAARDLAKEGILRLNEGKYEEARDLFERAYQIVPAPTVALLRGRALEHLGKLVEAAESYETAKRTPLDQNSPEAFRTAQAEAQRELLRLQPQIPKISALVSGVPQDYAGLEVKLDDKPLPRALVGATLPVNPGEHLLMVSVDDTVHDTRRITVSTGQKVKVLLRVEVPEKRALVPPAAPPPPAPAPGDERKLLGWASLGLGGVGFITGIVAGLAMLGFKAELDDRCRPLCRASMEDELRRFRFTRTVSAVGYGVGFVGLGAGTALLLLDPVAAKPEASRALVPALGPGSVGVRGRF